MDHTSGMMWTLAGVRRACLLCSLPAGLPHGPCWCPQVSTLTTGRLHGIISLSGLLPSLHPLAPLGLKHITPLTQGSDFP